MYLQKLVLENVKLIDRLELDFSAGNGPRMWTVLVGPNGTCKTTILQAIALLASGGTRGLALAQNGRINLMEALRPVRRGPSAPPSSVPVRMTAEFAFGPIGLRNGREYPGLPGEHRDKARLSSQLRLPPEKDLLIHSSEWMDCGSVEHQDPLEEIRTARGDLPKPHWFVAGYGVNRNLPRAGRPNLDVDVIDRLMSLFDGRDLTATAFADTFELNREAHPGLAERYRAILQKVFQHGSLLPHVQRALLGNGGTERGHRHRIGLRQGEEAELLLPAQWLSQGYQSSVAWIADLVGWIVREAETDVPAEEMEGLVLVDEIDLHLHPSWQKGLIEALREVFPALQFVATTHSPMVLPALGSSEIIRLGLERGTIKSRPVEQPPWQMTGTELYRSVFGIEALHPGRRGSLAWRYAELANDPFRSAKEEEEITRIERELKELGVHLSLSPTERQRS